MVKPLVRGIRLCLHDEFQPGMHIKAIGHLLDNTGWRKNPKNVHVLLAVQPGLKRFVYFAGSFFKKLYG